MTNPGFKSGFVAIIGRPNVGKSTLLNRIVGEKIAIMSNKAQTTRNKIQGIYTTNEAQVVFIDTPGVHKPQNSLGDYMVKSAFSALHEADAIWFVVDASQKRGGGDNYIIDRLKEVTKTPIYLLVNKVDLLPKEELFEVIQSYQEDAPAWKEIFPISATEGDNVPELLETVIGDLDEGPQYFDSDQLTDHPERFVISELIREKVLQLTKQEVPHSVAVVIDKISSDDDGLVSIQASIIVERASQKNIVIGKQGRMIKEIGTRARKDIERLLGSKVFLETWVKVEERWRDRPQALQSFGYRKDDF
ncbi:MULTISPECIES: GTPase Era [Fructobacillus]|uniref:GTPase Era n=1 Tax=Fructobacillus evanidus TaxID=3064281 RepID=A0ABM9N085_9LACO|nr:GTPase Era [Fructobacillus tropaeoli]CAK1242882.1 GTPase Era [Fructobacillus sp. LMG 32999]CAK1232180.1 GTPase Era [Fructobacillus tropaeoli]CAK1245860.1 GTPase Era [Fructobacillus sp. LMG 32999]CAK1250783.1 GTPase Era [Fructobacillus sp. LMG 32999]CAK1251455.1 GTPase Era [Fructobacillus sp. LMG 32999]